MSVVVFWFCMFCLYMFIAILLCAVFAGLTAQSKLGRFALNILALFCVPCVTIVVALCYIMDWVMEKVVEYRNHKRGLT